MNKVERLWRLRHNLLIRLDTEMNSTEELFDKLDKVESLLRANGEEV